ncbi:MAG: DsrE family protein [bacterium]|nr:DsrE family protein [bacterium]
MGIVLKKTLASGLMGLLFMGLQGRELPAQTADAQVLPPDSKSENASPDLLAQRGRGGRGFQGGRGQHAENQAMPPGRGMGPGRGGMGGHDERHQADHDVFQYLLTNHEKIRRQVEERPDGVLTLTESDDPEVAAKIQEHVHWMDYRIEKIQPIRMRDPLFAELFRSAEKIEMTVEKTEKGVRVVETSKDPRVVKLIQAHAKVVSGFVERGFQEAMKNHPVPDSQAASARPSNPRIEKFGSVVQFPEAYQQPRKGSRIVVDVTGSAEADVLNASVEKVARYVNIYAGAGNEPADVEIAIVLHGGATLTCLNDDAYAEEFGVAKNPNLECLHELHEQGVAIFVCGQSLAGKGKAAEDVAVFVDVAVSALTSLVNLQQDGYVYIPLSK